MITVILKETHLELFDEGELKTEKLNKYQAKC